MKLLGTSLKDGWRWNDLVTEEGKSRKMKKPKTACMQKTIKALIARAEVIQDKAFTLSKSDDPVVAQKFDDVEGCMNDAASALYFAVELLESLDKYKGVD